MKKLFMSLFILAFVLVGCGEKPHLTTGDEAIDALTLDEASAAYRDRVADIEELDGDLSDANLTIEELEKKAQDLTDIVEGKQMIADPIPSVEYMQDGSGRREFIKPEDSLRLPFQFAYPNSKPTVGSTVLEMPTGLVVSPSQLWQIQTAPNTLNLFTESGIYGSIVTGTVESSSRGDLQTIQEYLHGHSGKPAITNNRDEIVTPEVPPFAGILAEIPSDPAFTAVYGEPVPEPIYVGGSEFGTQLVMGTLINSKSAVMRIGIFSYRGVSAVYCFVYESERSVEKEDVLNSLLGSLVVSRQQVTIG